MWKLFLLEKADFVQDWQKYIYNLYAVKQVLDRSDKNNK